MNHLELFSGTHSFGKVTNKLGYNVVSLDRDLGGECPLKSGYTSPKHFQEDIMTWNYTIYPRNHFKLITASPVCMWWSALRNCWIGRKIKAHGDTIITREILENDINIYGKPMVDKVFEIISYFNPEKWIVENPKTGKMKHYIKEKYPEYDTFYDVDYCMYSDFGYKKTTRFWTNIKDFNPLSCNGNCPNMVTIQTQKGAKHKGTGKLIKAKTRTLHRSPIGDHNKAVDPETKKIHKISLGSWGKKGTEQTGIGGGNNRLERYRIPEKLIEEIITVERRVHKVTIGHGDGSNWDGKQKLNRYRIPEKLISSILHNDALPHEQTDEEKSTDEEST